MNTCWRRWSSLAPTTTHTPEHLLQNTAVALFVDRARAVRNTFELTEENAEAVADICRRLDGLPLAIELAAARTKSFRRRRCWMRLSNRLQLLTGGPRDVPARLQTMRDAIAWSHDLLSPEHRAVFRACRVFAGGFNLDREALRHRGDPTRATTPSTRVTAAIRWNSSRDRRAGR